MADRYQQLVNTPIGKIVAKQVGLPNPPTLERYEPGQPVISGPVLLGAAAGSRLAGPLAAALASVDAEVLTAMDETLRTAAADAGLRRGDLQPRRRAGQPALQGARVRRHRDRLQRAAARGVGVPAPGHPPRAALRAGDRARHAARGLRRCPAQAVAQRALEGLTRAVGKEVRNGGTAQLVYVRPGGEGELESTLRFLLSPKSAFVSGQVVRIGPRVSARSVPTTRLGAPADRQGRAGHRRRPRDRRRDRRGAGPRRRARGRARHAGDERRADRRHGRDRRLGAGRRHHRRRRPGADRRAPARVPRRRRRRRPQRRRDPRQDARADERGAVGHGDRHQPDRAAADRQGAVRAQGGARQRPHRLRLLDQRHRRQRRPDQLLDLQGRGDRDRAGVRARPGQARRDDQRRRARASSRRR